MPRAFNTLTQKIEALRIPGYVNKWITSFLSERNKWMTSILSERKIKVKIGRNISDYCDLNTDTHQVSVIGPLIFNVFINNLTK